jgi:hypothetical protein
MLAAQMGEKSQELHEELRNALRVLRSAVDWLEGTMHFDTAHLALDWAGELARTEYAEGCALEYENGSYFVVCPVALAHNRIGMSPGMLVREAECSICGRDPDLCEHIKGRVYDGETCVRIVKQVDLLEVSFVARPAQPDARIMRVSVPRAELAERFGQGFQPGVQINCDRCLSPCDGVRYPSDLQGHFGE